tara:strand:- start:277 stop:960 length:684 start_codon:yes stop_codon:yes gene_type:complete
MSNTAFDTAFALLKMPIDWDSVTELEPYKTRKKGRSVTSKGRATWVHPETGERFPMVVRLHELTNRNKDATRRTVNVGVGHKHDEIFEDETGEIDPNTAYEVFVHSMNNKRLPIEIADLDGYDSQKDPRIVPMPVVEEDYQGLGLGTDMYDLLTHYGIKLRPDNSQSPQARRMWLRNAGFDRGTAEIFSDNVMPRSKYRALLDHDNYTWRGRDEREENDNDANPNSV